MNAGPSGFSKLRRTKTQLGLNRWSLTRLLAPSASRSRWLDPLWVPNSDQCAYCALFSLDLPSPAA